MALKAILAIVKGICPRCKEPDVWLFSWKGEIICDDCIRELEQENEA